VLISRKEDDFNAIDPNIFFDAQGHAWMSFGSFWSGIKMLRIDAKSGKLSAEDTKLYIRWPRASGRKIRDGIRGGCRATGKLSKPR
jgi:arabinan endo-1,5-alpha-L-arabinosidase